MGRGVVDVFSRTVIDVVDRKFSPLELCHPAELVVLPVKPVKPALLNSSSSAHSTIYSTEWPVEQCLRLTRLEVVPESRDKWPNHLCSRIMHNPGVVLVNRRNREQNVNTD